MRKNLFLGPGWPSVLVVSFLAHSTFVWADTPLANLSIVRVKERIPLEQLAANVSDPLSDRFQKYYTPDEIKELSGPTDAEAAWITEDLRQKGYKVESTDKTGLFWYVSQIPVITSGFQAFGFAPAPALAAPAPLENTSVTGVESITPNDETFHMSPKVVFAKQQPQDSNALAFSYSPRKIQSLYGFTPLYRSGLSGRGQHIAIATYEGFNMRDIREYFQKNYLRTQSRVDQIIFNGIPEYEVGAASETELDTEFAGILAPGAEIHIFASAENSSIGQTQLFSAILDDNRSKSVNYSWGVCEKYVGKAHRENMDKIFTRAIAQGVNIYVSSGDAGATGCPINKKILSADWPSANPNVISVGGTTLNERKKRPAETAWSNSGGGISDFYPSPAWQQQAAIGSAFVRRSIPDVAFNADPETGQPAWIHEHVDPDDQSSPTELRWVVVGGTSIASPQWAAFNALVNEAREGKASLGALGPLVYGLTPDQKSLAFNDVVKGENHGYKAGLGWDAITGWGSLNADALLSILAQ